MNRITSINWNTVALTYLGLLGLLAATVLVAVMCFALIFQAIEAVYASDVPLFTLEDRSQDLTGLQILDTDQITCGEDSHASITWANETDSPIYITKAQVWMGMFKGSVSDFAVWVQRVERPSTLMHSNWDHYTDPVGPDHYIQMDYSPHHIAVKPGESISLNSFCSNMENSAAVGHAVLTIWYYQ